MSCQNTLPDGIAKQQFVLISYAQSASRDRREAILYHRVDYVFALCDHRCHLTSLATRRHYEEKEKVADRRVAFVVRCDRIVIGPRCGRSQDLRRSWGAHMVTI